MSFKKRLISFKYAFAGLADLFKTQPNAVIHAVVAFLVIVAGLFFEISRMEWIAIVLAVAAVFSAEAFNTALEYLTDLVSPDKNPLAGKTKDAAAAGVLIVAMSAVVVGLLVFLPKVLEWLKRLDFI